MGAVAESLYELSVAELVVRIEVLELRLDTALDDLQEARATEQALRVRQQELLQAIVKLTNELPYPDEVKVWTEQRAKLIAEIGTLRSRVAELEATGDAPGSGLRERSAPTPV